MPTLPRLALSTLIGGLLLAGCAQHENARKTTTTTTTSTSTSTSTTSAPAAPRRKPAAASAAEAPLPDRTGIPACDDYLSSYLACHRVAAIFAPDQLQARYEAMRTSLLRDSQNPDIRPQLASRCNALADQLREALHGKSCVAAPATP